MTLNADEVARTARELRANVDLSGLTRDEVAADLGLATARHATALDARGPSDPVDVWQLRDHLDGAGTT
ncbi:DUF2316 family protein [Isoptericola sp. NPDC019482]|uniref:DUF2316 family protein n=1 Tax=Isoptericola sp. NPDC019482 TaxID=3154688 RepID=UPI00347D600B